MELLNLLVDRSGELVTREEIATRLWSEPESVDVTHGSNTAINPLRTLLGDNPTSPVSLETVVTKGYRFVARVTALEWPVHKNIMAENEQRRSYLPTSLNLLRLDVEHFFERTCLCHVLFEVAFKPEYQG